MEIKITKINLLTALNRCIGVVPVKGPIIQVTHFLLETTGDVLAVTGTDLGNTVRCTVNAEVIREGIAIVNARRLLGIVKELPTDKDITLVSGEAETLLLKCAKSRFKLPCLEPNTFPDCNLKGFDKVAVLKGSDLALWLKQIMFAVCSPDLSLTATGALMSFTENKLVLVGTDGHRLARVVAEIMSELVGKVIISKKGLSEIKKVADAFVKSEITLSLSPSFICCQAEGIELYCRLNEEKFPDYRKAIPETIKTLTVSADELQKSVRRVALLSDELSHSIRLAFSGTTLTITSLDSDYGDASDTLSIETVNEDVTLIFNATFLLDFLNITDGEDIEINVKDELAPCLFSIKGNNNYVCLIMPLQRS